MENTSDRVKTMEKPTPDFAIFQNDRARVSGVWIKEAGEWRVCPERDFEPLEVIATMLRKSPGPEVTRMRIAGIIAKIREGSDL